jgi:sulfoxide reductase heme-binding subunit YedZ
VWLADSGASAMNIAAMAPCTSNMSAGRAFIPNVISEGINPPSPAISLMMTRNQQIRWLMKPALFLASVAPSAWLAWAASRGELSANPLADVTNETGVWGIRFLCLTLAVTPLRRLTAWNDAIRFRRMLGLFAFYYGSLHLLTYVIADRLAGLDFENGVLVWATARDLAVAVASDVVKRPFITIGFTAWLCLLPLAITSTSAMIRRLGGRRWQALHRLTYVAASLGVLQMYALIVGALLAVRGWRWARSASAPTMRRAAA